MSFYQLHRTQKIPAPLDQVWEFIASPANLKKITPPYMGFDILSEELPQRMYPGMIIRYQVRPVLGIRMTWVTEITHLREQEYFVDEQRLGPYAMWHHLHRLQAIEGGVLMSDTVSYRLPFYFMGSLAHALFVKKQLREIFDYRVQAVEEIFGKME